MAKDKTAPKGGGVRKVPWRGTDVFACGSSGCTYAHERKDRVEEHMARGRHQAPRTQAPKPGASATEPNAGPEVAQEPTEAAEASTGGES